MIDATDETSLGENHGTVSEYAEMTAAAGVARPTPRPVPTIEEVMREEESEFEEEPDESDEDGTPLLSEEHVMETSQHTTEEEIER